MKHEVCRLTKATSTLNGIYCNIAKNSGAELGDHIHDLSERSAALLKEVTELAGEMEGYYPQLLDAERTDVMNEEIHDKVKELSRAGELLWDASTGAYDMSDELSARWGDIRRAKRKRGLLSPPANTAIDLVENTTDHFARGLNYYKLFLLCFVGSFLGVVIETIFVLATRGIWMNRVGLVYGPFNLLYGAGAVILTLALYRFRNRGSWLSFLGGMVIGSVVEYVCSWAQEMAFGSRSWDYSNAPFNINGRICLLFTIFWGILGVFWIKNIYPRMTQWILKIPEKAGKPAVWVLTVFLVFNSAVSVISVYRWSQRLDNVPPRGQFWEMIDERFPDERMERTFPSMKFKKK